MGILLIYQNDLKSKKILKEDLTFSGLKGLHILGQKNQNKVEFILKPGETKEIWLNFKLNKN